MKIGILTLELKDNYGGILQAYALQSVLKSMGHEVHFITKNRYRKPKLLPDPFLKRFVSYPLRFVRKYILGKKNLVIRFEHQANETILNLTRNTEPFIKKHLTIDDYLDFAYIPSNQYDAIVVGSDQVWRRKYFNDVDKIQNAYLAFTNGWDVIRLSYAASFGVDNINDYDDEIKSECSGLIKAFNGVSVREKSGVSICANEFDVEATQVLDPTLLLDSEDYESLISPLTDYVSDSILFYYLLDESEQVLNQVQKLGIKQSLTPYRVNASPLASNKSLDERIQKPITVWLDAFRKSSLVVTDSFHACVFSIIFNKPFYVIRNEVRGVSRIESLLTEFGLQDRLVPIADIDKLTDHAIDWTNVNNHRHELIEKSKAFLINVLK